MSKIHPNLFLCWVLLYLVMGLISKADCLKQESNNNKITNTFRRTSDVIAFSAHTLPLAADTNVILFVLPACLTKPTL